MGLLEAVHRSSPFLKPMSLPFDVESLGVRSEVFSLTGGISRVHQLPPTTSLTHHSWFPDPKLDSEDWDLP